MKPFDCAKHWIAVLGPDSTLKKAAKMFRDECMGSILIKDDDGNPMGLLTDNVVYDCIAEGIDLSGKRVSDIKLENLVMLPKDAELEDIMAAFKKSPSGRIAMTDREGTIVGILKRKNLERFSMLRIAKNYRKK
jgi:predicted transcriptional regulator